jgi:hypothetical protein
MADFPSFAVLPKTGDIQPTIVPSDTDAISTINFYLERSGYHTEHRKFYQKLMQTFSLPEVPEGDWTLTVITATGSSAVEGATASVTVTAGATIEVTLTAATGFTAPSGSTLLNRGNSYAWLGDAEGYFETRYGASGWAALSDTDKEYLLITSTGLIDRAFRFVGQKLDDGQQLAFPRFVRRGAISAVDDMRFIPREVFEAVCEQAWYIYNEGKPDSDRKQLQAEGVSHISIGRVSETYLGDSRMLANINAFAKDKLNHWISRVRKYDGAYSPYVPTS